MNWDWLLEVVLVDNCKFEVSLELSLLNMLILKCMFYMFFVWWQKGGEGKIGDTMPKFFQNLSKFNYLTPNLVNMFDKSVKVRASL